MRLPRFLLPAVALLTVVPALAGCAAPGPEVGDRGATGATSSSTMPGSDAVPTDGVRELAEPALQITSLAPDGAVVQLDLASEESAEIARIAPAERVVGDGRYLFALRPGSVTVVDSGAWTWNHGDHVHYYRGEARVVGDVSGDGWPTVVPGERSIGIHFDGGPEGVSEAVLVKAAPLADGEIVELFRIGAEAHAPLVVPLAYGAWVAESAATGQTATLREVGEDGRRGEETACRGARSPIVTVVGVVVECHDGALLAVDGRPARAERIPLPGDAASPASTSSLAGREGRPTVAALAGEHGIRLLDTRDRQWRHLASEAPLVAVTAVDDRDGHVVAVTAEGAIRVFTDEAGSPVPVEVALDEQDAALLARAGSAVALFPEQHTTYVVAGGRVLAIDPVTARVERRYSVPADGAAVLSGR